jgi:hypothetical protein
MRLLDTSTYELRSFTINKPQYAILSHTWDEEEVTFADLANEESRTELKGWMKLTQCCARALQDGWKWVWIDTCCIDKRDPTELGEAINSMYR